MSKYLLSISIPTYNRKRELEELISDLLKNTDDRIQIVVTDNKSTDETRTYLKAILNPKIKVCLNEVAVPGYYNMILGLFNADGKYVIHCNDRDILDASRINELVDFLDGKEFSFIQTSRSYGKPTNKLEIFEKGYDSLVHQNFSSHPTGMIFNTEIMHNYLKKENYLKYVDDTFTYCFLMRELIRFEKSAKYDNRCWNERHSIIKTKLKSGSIYNGGLYFEPDRICVFMRSVIKHILDSELFDLTEEQRKKLIINVIDYFKNQLVFKKLCYADYRECVHYGIKKRHIGYIEMKKIYEMYIFECEKYIKEIGYMEKVRTVWDENKRLYKRYILRDCFKTDKAILYKNFKRLTDKSYPY